MKNKLIKELGCSEEVALKIISELKAIGFLNPTLKEAKKYGENDEKEEADAVYWVDLKEMKGLLEFNASGEIL